MKLVDKNSKVPLHIQLSEIIKDMIDSNQLQQGHYLMSERDICKTQNISRMTVNKAIMNLVNEGLLERRQGKGTFVSYKKQNITYEKILGFTEIMQSKNKQVKNKIIKFKLSKADKPIYEKLELDNESDLVFQIERIRYVDDEPTILEKIYIPQDMCLGLTEDLVDKNSLYKLYREVYLHKTKKATQIINPVLLNKNECNLLQTDSSTLALKIDRKVFTDDDKILEYTSSLFITNKHQYEVVLYED